MFRVSRVKGVGVQGLGFRSLEFKVWGMSQASIMDLVCTKAWPCRV